MYEGNPNSTFYVLSDGQINSYSILTMKRTQFFFSLLIAAVLLTAADGCSSDPNVEGAKLDLRNKDYDRALNNLDKALETNPQNAEAYELKGQVLLEQAFTVDDPAEHTRMLFEMEDAFKKALQYDPALEETVVRSLRIAYANEFQRAVQAFNRGRNDDSEFAVAAGYFGNAATLQPDSSAAYVNQAYAYMNAGDPNGALEPFEKAIEKGDTEPETFRFLAGLYASNDRMDDAIATLEQATGMYPDNVDLQTELLNAYQVSGQTDKAMQQYRSAVERDPDNELFRYNYGTLLTQTGEYDEALAQLKKAVELDPNYANAYFNLGAVYINQAVDVNERISDLDDALRAERRNLSDDEAERRDREIETLTDERRELFRQAVAPLEKAKTMFEDVGEDAAAVCRALFQAYVQINETDKAQSIATCAGYDDTGN